MADEFFNVLEIMYPIGSIYLSVNNTPPPIGSWEQIKDRFLLACGDSYIANSTGGAATHRHYYAMLSSHFYGGIASSDNTPGDGISLWDYEKNTWVLGNQDSSPQAGKTVNSALEGHIESNSSARTNNTQAKTSSGSSLPPYIAIYVFKRVS